MTIVTIFVWLLISLLTAVFIFYKKRYTYWKNRGAEYVEPTIPFGNLPASQVHFKDMTLPIYDRKKDGVPFLGAFFFAIPVAVATDLDFIQNVLVRDFSSFHERGMYTNEADDPLSGHMFSVDGEKWKSLRNKLSPTFSSGKMKFMFPTVVVVAERFIEILVDLTETAEILEMKDLLARFTTDIIGTCAFGIECNSLKEPKSEFRRYGRKVFDEPHLGSFMQILVIQYPDLCRKLHVRTVAKDVSEFFMNLVRDTVAYRENNNIRRNDFMDLLIQLKNGETLDADQSRGLGQLTFEDVVAQAFIFFLAGFETSSTTMMFALYELALNPEIQQRGRNEVKQILEKHNGKLTYEAVKEMVYIDQIISETLRKYPPVVNIIRRCAREYPVPNSNVVIDKGISVFIPAYAIHHDPNIYAEPEKFDPDRFSPEEIKSRHAMSFLGFGDGPRNCIGLRFGRMQTQIGLILLLKNFQFSPCEKTTIPMVFATDKPVLSPKNGMYLKGKTIE